MNAGYRLLQFVPDPFLPTAFTFGAFVEDEAGGRVALAEAGEDILSSKASLAVTSLFRALVAELRHLEKGRLPLSVGPHVRMSERFEVPMGVTNAASWVSTFVLPTQAIAQKRDRRHQRTRRATIGKLFFKQHRVGQFVKSRFRPEMLGGSPRLLKPITHYVQGLDTLLLEPLYLDSERFEEEMQEAASTLLAWETLARKKNAERIEFYVYALGTSAQHLKFLREGVGDTGIRVIDTERTSERDGLLARISAASESRQLDS